MAEEAAKGGGSAKLVVLMIVGAILLVAVSMGGVFFLLKSMGLLNPGGPTQDISPNDPAIYMPLEPPFVVNFKERGRTRYLQVTVEIMTRDPLVIPEIEKHLPMIRNNLLLLFSSQPAETLHTNEGKEAMQQAALKEIQTIVKNESGLIGVEAVFFTSFVMQ